MADTPHPLIVVTGATASGKTKLAVRIAAALDTTVLSVDSRQVYRGMDIGTGKDYADFVFDGKPVEVKLMDIVDAGTDFHIDAYLKHFEKEYNLLHDQGKIPVLCGGSGLYLDAVLNGYRFTQIPVDHVLRDELEQQETADLKARFHALDENAYTALADLSTRKRTIRAIEIGTYLLSNPDPLSILPPFRPYVIAIRQTQNERWQRIEERLLARLKEGMVDEVAGLRKKIPDRVLMRYGLEYAHITRFLRGEVSGQEMFEQLNIAIRQFSKRQLTYLRKMERAGCFINWAEPGTESEKIIQSVRDWLSENS